MSKKVLKIGAVLILLIGAAFCYLNTEDGKELLQRNRDTLTVTEAGAETVEAEEIAEEEIPDGLSEKQKEEVLEILETYLCGDGKEKVETYARETLEESIRTMLEDGRLQSAVDNYVTTQASLVNINTADETELMKLPGIGQAKALAIVTYRTENGKFQSVEELTNVSGISTKTLDKFRDRVTV